MEAYMRSKLRNWRGELWTACRMGADERNEVRQEQFGCLMCVLFAPHTKKKKRPLLVLIIDFVCLFFPSYITLSHHVHNVKKYCHIITKDLHLCQCQTSPMHAQRKTLKGYNISLILIFPEQCQFALAGSHGGRCVAGFFTS